MARRYFTHMGPSTIHDAMYYFHATAAQVKDWLSRLPVVAVECEGKTYYFIDSDQIYDGEIPTCIFLAGFDQLLLAHEKKESLFLQEENRRAIFNLAGIVMPALLFDGEVAGKWKKKNEKLWISLFKPITQREKNSISDFAGSLWSEIASIRFEK